MPYSTRSEIIRCTILLFNQYGPMVPMSKISEAAGVAAAMQAQNNGEAPDARQLQTVLMRNGVLLQPELFETFAD